MPPSDDAINALREALRFSPTNIPLHKHLAESLLKLGRFDEAEAAYREALQVVPHQVDLKLGLANAYYQQTKNSAALVIVEDLIKQNDPPAGAYVLHAKLLLRAGEPQRAAHQYREAIEIDADAADAELARELGLDRAAANSFDTADEEGRYREPAGELPPGTPEFDIERPKINFDQVGGMDAVKEEIRMKIILPLEQPELFAAYGKTVGGGILMYGPPGCGKTFLARATAGQVKAGFLAIGISDVLDMWIGNSEKNLHELFQQARRNRPCVLFFDEVDALGASRADMRHSGGRHLINQFLSELDGVESSNEGLLILAATNAPWHLDNAFRRPGRFDRILFVPPPDRAARASILQLMLAGKPADGVDFDAVAKKTDHFSGADMKAVVDVAVEAKLRDAMKSGKLEPLRTKDLVAAAGTVKPSTREWFATARNYALYSNQGGVYDDILKHLKL
ncbi:MAG: AAA family ATPase [Planctomycetaceae bacterium]|nr:AAA family ATPase [Planctomycetaceae bacterium]